MSMTTGPGAADQSRPEAEPQPVCAPTGHSVPWRRPAMLLSICAVIAALASSGALQESVRELLIAVRPLVQEHAIAGALPLVGLAALSAMAAFVSVAVLVPVAVFVWGEVATIVLLWLGWILGGVLAYTQQSARVLPEMFKRSSGPRNTVHVGGSQKLSCACLAH